MTAVIIVHPAYLARMALRQLLVWADNYKLVASSVRAPSGNNYIILERAK